MARRISLRGGTGAQLYIPQGVAFRKELSVVEGEFKAMALCEAGIRAVGGGISSAVHEGQLIPDLSRVIRKYNPSIVYFLGDNDTALNFEFSRGAVKLARALPEGSTLKLPRIALSMPKEIDDCREELGDCFMDFWKTDSKHSTRRFP
jgi:hypothetical protein